MNFISHGDFIFPFTWPYYLYKQFFMWSYRSGTPNPDGIIKMPGRLPELLVFGLTGDNLAVSYFFLATSLMLVFAAFYYFTGAFLRIDSVRIKLLGATLYTLNPVTLGNLAKTGLIVAAAMLPISLVAIQRLFLRRQLRYLLLLIVCLNISLIHPFTFIVNGAVSGVYFVYLGWEHRQFLLSRWRSFALFGGLALLLSAYFLLPMASMRTLSKDVIKDTADQSATDYTAMVEILSTRDILTGFSLSKDVVIDFAYYGGGYTALYFTGIIAFYMLLFGLYILVEKRLTDADRRRITLSLGIFLVLILLATVTVWNVDALIKLLIQLPGGWAFRSPLKWQLYIPIVLGVMLVTLLKYIRAERWQKYVYGGMACILLLMNGYLFVDIYRHLLKPRPVEYFGGLQARRFDHQNMLLVNSYECTSPDISNRRMRTELKQILISKDIQYKQLNPDQASTINLSAYDYIMDCQNLMKDTLQKQYNFRKEDTYASGMFQLYANQDKQPYMYASGTLFSTTAEHLGDKQAFVADEFGEPFTFIDPELTDVSTPLTTLIDPYENISLDSIRNGDIEGSAELKGGKATLYADNRKDSLHYAYDKDARRVSLSPKAQPGFTPLDNVSGFQPIVLKGLQSGMAQTTYSDDTYDYANLLKNPSLEDGPWEKTVGDCYAVDDKADIGMEPDKSQQTDGSQSLKLRARNHIACTGPPKIAVKPGEYLLSFDYRSDGGRHAGYAVMFNKPDRTVLTRRLPRTSGQWGRHVQTISVPKGVTSMRLLLHTYPDTPGVIDGTAYYDNFQLVSIPDVQNRMYFMEQPATDLRRPGVVSYKIVNPTKSIVNIQNTSTPFYLVSKESYNEKWQLSLHDPKVSLWSPFAGKQSVTEDKHLKANGTMNAWYIDPAAICGENKAGCTRRADGSYDIELVAEFTPQRWFYLGTIISGLTFIGCLGGVAYVTYRDKNGKEYRHGRGG